MSLAENVGGLDLELDDQDQAQLATHLPVALAGCLPAVKTHLAHHIVNFLDDFLHDDWRGFAPHGLEQLRKRCLAAFLAWLAGEEVTLQAFR